MEKGVMDFLLEFRNGITQQFDQINKRFEQIDKRFEQIDKRFEQIDKRFEQIDKRFANVENRLDQHEMMIKQLIDIVGATNKKVDSFIAEQSDKLDKIQKQLDVIASQQTDIELAHQKITKNERDIAKIKALLLG
ncbi:hypothetical protein BHF71_09290 [Vulcanibacillus modesticaldus]|uniref:t-SNARE coiled-coil homology domain-containing protein n=1 Tax=Vulcanibacillus modesticaldus TaxID=337097 RepID=A0A1D2YUB9_9BACI|nr:hypothetical protein [Vulcanibacillus modesticaldus]OEF99263.1 hypothetical protein BHF71_09290 [Vulcanibacillus modesticaldus]